MPEQNNIFYQIPTKEDLMLLYEGSVSNDPASISYKRKLVRPNVHIIRSLLFLLASIACSAAVAFAVYCIFKKNTAALIGGLLYLLICLIVHLKMIVLFSVRCYQRFAPESLRTRCRFEPSCSEYMILAVNKYGTVRGVVKGVKRICRCKYPNGGIDEP